MSTFATSEPDMAGFFVVSNDLNRQAAKAAKKFECEAVLALNAMIFR
jgi:hypothetical protein